MVQRAQHGLCFIPVFKAGDPRICGECHRVNRYAKSVSLVLDWLECHQQDLLFVMSSNDSAMLSPPLLTLQPMSSLRRVRRGLKSWFLSLVGVCAFLTVG